MENEKTIYMIDGSAYIYRAYHAVRGLSNSKGLPTNAVFGFTRMLLKLIEDHSPEYIGMFFDSKGPTFRHKMYKEYKANRPPMPEDLSVQVPYIKKVTEGFNLPAIEMEGFEADDLIGTFARMAEESGFSVVMVTGDKDFMQLVTDKSIIWDPMKDKTIDVKSIMEVNGVEPSMMIDVMGLSGDTADNIPGVPGIGPKTALSLIKTFGSMKNLYEKVDKITKKKQHENLVKYREQAFLSRELVTINTSVPLEFSPLEFEFKEPDNAKLSKLFKDLEFRQLQKTFPEKADLSKKDYRWVHSIKELSDLISRLRTAQVFAIDTETTSKNPMKANLVGLSFSMKADEAFYIPCAHDYPDMPEQLPLKDVLNLLKPLLENPDIKKIGQNIKYDWIVLDRHGINLEGVVFDTMLASYLINPSKRAHNLDQIALDFLDHKTITYKEVVGKGKNASGFAQVPIEKAVPYACEDADITLMACNVLGPELNKAGLTELLEEVEMPLVPVLMKMEMTGICVNKDKLHSLSKTFEIKLGTLEKSIYEIAGERFNIKSTQQLGHILFDKLKLPTGKKTKKKTGFSTDVDVLTELAVNHELPALILKHRTLAKLKSTYTDALLDLVHPETDRIHTSFNQTVTATGRLSSSDPNLQNIPIRTDEGREIRRAFVPKKGWHLVSADYSQVELRILAHCSDDQILIKAFMEDEDIHMRTAAEVFQVFPSFLTPELRQQAKAINFGIIYGMSPFGLSKQLEISRKMAKTYIDNYFARYKGVKKYIDSTIEEAIKTKQTSTLLGRIRLLPDINSPNRNIRQFAERIAINTPIQGSAADLIKVAMIKMDQTFKEKKLKSAMLLSVHDELIFEVPPDELNTVKKLVKKIMEGVWELKVPLKVNVACGENWAEAH
ncbi:MAG: DNA polymerase I [Desulfobacterales bacterium]|nr:DNA polymerase I [Desulfobacterales bacterium]MDX2510101.1 DNA polymerase I [Desulfobacterales bacterium]